MAWQQVCRFDLFYSNFPVAIPYSFATDQVVLRIVSRRSDNYHKAGLLWSLTDLPNVGIVRSTPIKVYLLTQLLNIPRLQGREYTLEFLPFGYISDLILTLWEDATERYIQDTSNRVNLSKKLEAIDLDLQRIEAKLDTSTGQ